MDRKRQLALVFATLGIALGAGHLVQNGAAPSVPQAAVPSQVTQVSAGPDVVQKPALPAADTAVPTSPVRAAAAAEPPPPPVIVADLSPSPLPALRAPVVAASLPSAAIAVQPAPIATVTVPVPSVTPATSMPQPAVTTVNACAPSLRLAAAPQAMVGISLLAPCAPEARVVISHAGLSITGKTNAQGSLFLSLPALEVDATITARLPDATEVEQTVRVPAMAALRRMGVQWHNADAFQLHAFENSAGYAEPGHVFAAKPQMPTTGLADTGGFMSMLGDGSVDMPMQAEIYTFPAGIAANADIVIEATVTDATCGRELMGETIMTLAGKVYITDLTLAMPGCDAVGDILVLKNLLTDLTIAAAN